MPGLYFEEFEAGQVFDHPIHRTITETDNVLFTTMTLNPQPLHLDAEFAAGTEFGQLPITKGTCFQRTLPSSMYSVTREGIVSMWN